MTIVEAAQEEITGMAPSALDPRYVVKRNSIGHSGIFYAPQQNQPFIPPVWTDFSEEKPSTRIRLNRQGPIGRVQQLHSLLERYTLNANQGMGHKSYLMLEEVIQLTKDLPLEATVFNAAEFSCRAAAFYHMGIIGAYKAERPAEGVECLTEAIILNEKVFALEPSPLNAQRLLRSLLDRACIYGYLLKRNDLALKDIDTAEQLVDMNADNLPGDVYTKERRVIHDLNGMFRPKRRNG